MNLAARMKVSNEELRDAGRFLADKLIHFFMFLYLSAISYLTWIPMSGCPNHALANILECFVLLIPTMAALGYNS